MLLTFPQTRTSASDLVSCAADGQGFSSRSDKAEGFVLFQAVLLSLGSKYINSTYFGA